MTTQTRQKYNVANNWLCLLICCCVCTCVYEKRWTIRIPFRKRKRPYNAL